MAINFDSLPTARPAGFVFPAGHYKATVETAELKTSKTGNPYLNIRSSLTDTAGKVVGKFYDIHTESDKDIPRYKLGAFIRALGINFEGATFELKDLTKLCVGKTYIVTLNVDEKRDPAQNQVEVFKEDPYYPIAMWASFGGQGGVPVNPTINAADATDAVAPVDAAEDLPF